MPRFLLYGRSEGLVMKMMTMMGACLLFLPPSLLCLVLNMLHIVHGAPSLSLTHRHTVNITLGS